MRGREAVNRDAGAKDVVRSTPLRAFQRQAEADRAVAFSEGPSFRMAVIPTPAEKAAEVRWRVRAFDASGTLLVEVYLDQWGTGGVVNGENVAFRYPRILEALKKVTCEFSKTHS